MTEQATSIADSVLKENLKSTTSVEEFKVPTVKSLALTNHDKENELHHDQVDSNLTDSFDTSSIGTSASSGKRKRIRKRKKKSPTSVLTVVSDNVQATPVTASVQPATAKSPVTVCLPSFSHSSSKNVHLR